MKVSGTKPEYNSKGYDSSNPFPRPYDISTTSNNNQKLNRKVLIFTI